jgi:hypothetical protein
VRLLSVGGGELEEANLIAYGNDLELRAVLFPAVL